MNQCKFLLLEKSVGISLLKKPIYAKLIEIEKEVLLILCETDKLLKEIEKLRNKMSSVALTQGITSLESIALSQELDRLLNIYEKVKNEKNMTR